MIATYIQDLLATNNRVIIPNYGAFLVRATSKSKDANTLEEKLKDIYFSPFLKFNDELLEKYIIKKENITKEQAAQKITQFIEDIKKELDQEKPYIIEGFGQFEADKQGKVQFLIATKEPARLSAEQAGPAGGKAEKPKEEKKPETTTKKSEPKAEIKPKAQETKKEKIKEKPKAAEAKPARPAGGKEEIKQEAKPARSAGGKESKLEEFKPEKKEESKATPAAAQTKSIYSYKKEKKPINKGLVWSIAIGVPIAAIFIWALLNFETVKKVLNKEKVKTEKVVQKKKATTTKKTAVKPKSEQTKTARPADEKETTAKAETKKPATPQKKYYIIAGSFKNEKYAISYLNKLNAEGYNAEKLAERNGMHAVSFNSFADKRKAIAEYKFLAQEKGLQAWILYY